MQGFMSNVIMYNIGNLDKRDEHAILLADRMLKKSQEKYVNYKIKMGTKELQIKVAKGEKLKKL